METTTTIDDAEVRFKGIVALNEALGPAGALRFLTVIRQITLKSPGVCTKVKASMISSHAPANSGRNSL